MGYEPTTHCNECGEPFDVYRAPDDRICDCCKEPDQITSFTPLTEKEAEDYKERMRADRASIYAT